MEVIIPLSAAYMLQGSPGVYTGTSSFASFTDICSTTPVSSAPAHAMRLSEFFTPSAIAAVSSFPRPVPGDTPILSRVSAISLCSILPQPSISIIHMNREATSTAASAITQPKAITYLLPIWHSATVKPCFSTILIRQGYWRSMGRRL